MSPEAVLARARQAWIDLAGVPVTFPVTGVEVVASADSRLCPTGWAGVVVLGGAGIATVPLDSLVPVVREALAGLSIDTVTDADQLRTKLPVNDFLGPASLAYLDEKDFRPAEGPAVQELPAEHDEFVALLASVDAADVDESGLSEITSPAFAVRGQVGIVAAAGYRRWPGSIAHLSVLTAAEHRGQGLAQIVASAAVADILRNQWLPQWRARPAASRRVAQALGFRRLGAQLSFRIEA